MERAFFEPNFCCISPYHSCSTKLSFFECEETYLVGMDGEVVI